MSDCAQHSCLLFGFGTDNSSWSFWDEGFPSCIRFHHSTCDMHAPFNEYCRQRFHAIFKNFPAQVLIDMDRENDRSRKMRKMEGIHVRLNAAYCQFPPAAPEPGYDDEDSAIVETDAKNSCKGVKAGPSQPAAVGQPVSMIQKALRSLTGLF